MAYIVMASLNELRGGSAIAKIALEVRALYGYGLYSYGLRRLGAKVVPTYKSWCCKKRDRPTPTPDLGHAATTPVRGLPRACVAFLHDHMVACCVSAAKFVASSLVCGVALGLLHASRASSRGRSAVAQKLIFKRVRGVVPR